MNKNIFPMSLEFSLLKDSFNATYKINKLREELEAMSKENEVYREQIEKIQTKVKNQKEVICAQATRIHNIKKTSHKRYQQIKNLKEKIK